MVLLFGSDVICGGVDIGGRGTAFCLHGVVETLIYIIGVPDKQPTAQHSGGAMEYYLGMLSVRGPAAGGGFLRTGQRAPPHHLGGLRQR